jgi:hypothetical protein
MGKNRFSYNAEDESTHIEQAPATPPTPEHPAQEILLDGKVVKIDLDKETIEILINDRTLTGG